jgi:DNA polymerase-1
MRRVAKTVNFGIIYGISPFGLASNLGVSQTEAKRYIDRYFENYQGVQRFIDQMLETATQQGYVTTLFGRRRHIAELSSHNTQTRGLGERLAVNTPLQGTAADIIKKAMIDIHRWMQESQVKSRMILQVHDELIFEVPENEITLMKEKVAAMMEGVIQLKAPLTVDIGVAKNWAEAH